MVIFNSYVKLPEGIYIYVNIYIYIIWGLPKMVVSKNGWSIMEHPIEIHD